VQAAQPFHCVRAAVELDRSAVGKYRAEFSLDIPHAGHVRRVILEILPDQIFGGGERWGDISIFRRRLLSFVVDALDDHVHDEGDRLAGAAMADDVSETFGRGVERPEMRPRQVRDGDDVGLKRGSRHVAVIAQLLQVVFASGAVDREHQNLFRL
jgi:hypothetical protein